MLTDTKQLAPLPSRFQIGDKVRLANRGVVGSVLAVRFTESKVSYDVDFPDRIIQNIDSNDVEPIDA